MTSPPPPPQTSSEIDGRWDLVHVRNVRTKIHDDRVTLSPKHECWALGRVQAFSSRPTAARRKERTQGLPEKPSPPSLFLLQRMVGRKSGIDRGGGEGDSYRWQVWRNGGVPRPFARLLADFLFLPSFAVFYPRSTYLSTATRWPTTTFRTRRASCPSLPPRRSRKPTSTRKHEE